ncbi:flavodoxin domain-containing protein [Blattabacterium cuenoti]|uniref:hypothetical protein n=1 Tax=Blattabacterium cuenoti TaxID=1653831 RepID=UPI00163BA2F9|nr:hypothetical protein [Blattabacterium cuenoti]
MFFYKGKEKNSEKVNGIILNNILLNKEKEKRKKYSKEYHHIEISMDKKLDYSPGDSIAIIAENSLDEVFDLMDFFQKKNFFFEKNEKDVMLNLFQKQLNIVSLSLNMLKKYSFLSEKIVVPLNNDDRNRKWNLIDLLKKFPIKKKIHLRDLIQIMDPIKPRLYSISSSPIVHNDEIHITVLRHRFFQKNGKRKYGFCSNFLSKLKKGDPLSFFVCNNRVFKLPKESNKDIILICSGTGIAPFRSFLYEREVHKNSGKNWLFFGNQHFETDFLYKKEIQNWKKNGVLNYVNLSFSRDQETKVYVQDKIWENREKLFSWIKNGAYIYICGKKNPMSIDVEKTLFRITKEKLGEFDSKVFIKKIKKDGRYLKDVY